MGALEVLFWILAALGGIILLGVILTAIALISIVVVGFRAMRDAETKGDQP